MGRGRAASSMASSGPDLRVVGGLVLLGLGGLIYFLSAPAAFPDIAADIRSIPPGVSTAAAVRGASASAKKTLLKTTKGAEGGHWEHIKGEDGQVYTQWQGGDPNGEPQMPGLMKGHLAVKGIVTEIATDGIKGFTTYSLNLVKESGSKARNVYTIFGDKAVALTMPPSFQVPTPFGVAIGGTNPAFHKLKPDAEYDSWLTVGITGGDHKNAIAKIGIEFEKWDEKTPLHADDGAVFWMDPDSAPEFENMESIDVGQVTVKSGMGIKAVVNAQGRSNKVGSDWVQQGILFKSK